MFCIAWPHARPALRLGPAQVTTLSVVSLTQESLRPAPAPLIGAPRRRDGVEVVEKSPARRRRDRHAVAACLNARRRPLPF